MKVSELIALLSKLPPDMELRKLNSNAEFEVTGSRDMGFKVVNGKLYHIYDVPTDPDGAYLEEYEMTTANKSETIGLMLDKPIEPEPPIEFGAVAENDTEVKPKRKRGDA